MANYYVNRNPQQNGDHEVHEAGCNRMPAEANRFYVGEFADCAAAVREARTYYDRANGCYWCSRPCHTG